MKTLRILIARYRLRRAERLSKAAVAHSQTALLHAVDERARLHAAAIAVKVEAGDLADIEWTRAVRVWQHLPKRTVRQLKQAGLVQP